MNKLKKALVMVLALAMVLTCNTGAGCGKTEQEIGFYL